MRAGIATTICRRNHSPSRQRKTESDAEDRRRYAYCRRNLSLLQQRKLVSDADLVASTIVAGETILLCGNEKQNWMRTSLPLRLLQAEPFSFAATKIRIGRGPRFRYDCSRRNHSSSRQRRLESAADLVAATPVAGGTILRRGNENQNRTRTSLPLRL